jgi:iron complex transport system substrate-binding protein
MSRRARYWASGLAENQTTKRPAGRCLVKRLPRVVLLALSLLVAVTIVAAGACGESKPEPETGFTVTDDLGKTFSFDGPVNSIVSLAPANTEIVFAIGAGDKLIGRTDYCNYPPEAASVESVGSFDSPNKEKVVVLNPDVVLATDIHDQSGDTAWLEEKGLKVITLNPQTLTDILADISLVGQITGKEAEAGELAADMQSKIDYVAQQTAGLSDNQRLRVLHVTWHDPLWTEGQGSFIDALIEIAGGVNMFHDVSGDAQVDLETAVTRNPEVITVFTGAGSATTQSYDYIVGSDSPFKTTDAYKNGRIYLIDADVASRAGPRIVEALEMYAKFIHPEIFGQPE